MSEKKKSKALVILLIVGIVILAVGLGCLIKDCRHEESKTTVAKPDLNPNKYNILVEDWNRAIINAQIGNSYYLPEANPEGVIKSLNIFIKPFYESFNEKIEKDIIDIAMGRKNSFFFFYRDFLAKHRIKTKEIFSVSQSSLEIKKILKQLTGENSVNTMMISIIVSMKNPCIFLNRFKQELYGKGMSRSLQSCTDLSVIVDESKYKNLYDFIKECM